jgi:hypothetical protein
MSKAPVIKYRWSTQNSAYYVQGTCCWIGRVNTRKCITQNARAISNSAYNMQPAYRAGQTEEYVLLKAISGKEKKSDLKHVDPSNRKSSKKENETRLYIFLLLV